jgi:hypothetical protein
MLRLLRCASILCLGISSTLLSVALLAQEAPSRRPPPMMPPPMMPAPAPMPAPEAGPVSGLSLDQCRRIAGVFFDLPQEIQIDYAAELRRCIDAVAGG